MMLIKKHMRTPTLMKKISIPSITLALLILAAPSIYAAELLDVNRKNQAVKGYDTVAYFTESKAVKGDGEYQYEWNGATWLFANEEHLKLFQESPEKYAPQYGGYCAWAIGAKNTLYGINPKIWNIVDGKLYLNYNKRIGKKWEKDIPGLITKGNAAWEKMLLKENDQ